MKIAFAVLLLFVFLSSCTKNATPDRASVVSKLKNSAKLATVEYVVTKVIKAEKKGIILPNSYFFAHTEAFIKAGIDLNKLEEEDIKVENLKVSVTLPPIEIINFSYPADSFKLVDKYTTKPGFFSRQFTLEQRDELYRQGEVAIRASLKDLGIINTAQENARRLLQKILEAAGFKEIYIKFKPSELASDVDTRAEETTTKK